jgi:hypothetical protein
MIGVDYGVLNQKGSPSWFSDIYANIPTAGYKGRMFISIDTYAFYRDTGTGWDLIGGPGTGTITGSGTSGQVSYFNGSSTLAGSNNLFWDITNSRLGIGTATPGASLDIHATGTNAQFNGTGTSNAYLVFQNAGTSKWRIGNTYNAGANSFEIYNNGLTTTALSINSTTNNAIFSGSIFTNNGWIAIKENVGTANTSTYLTLNASSTGSTIESLIMGLSSGNVSTLNFSTSSNFGYTFPSASGTIAILEAGTQTFTGTLNVLGSLGTKYGISIEKGNTPSPLSANDIFIYASSGATNIINFANSSYKATLSFPASNQTYTFPATTGTIALTSDIPANIVTGTGASGQVGYWTGSATQSGTNNLFWDNSNTRLGINTNAPLSTLQVVPVTLSSTIVRFGEASGTTGKQLLFGIDSTTGRSEIQSVWQGTANTPLGLNVAGGNVLIGTTTDGGYKLSVSGTGNFSGALTGDSTANFTSNVQSSAFYRSNTPTTDSITIGVSANNNYAFIGNSNYWGIRTGTAGDFNIDVNNSSSPINALKISQSRVVTLLSLGTGAVTATSGVLSTTSDMNLKISDGYIDNALDKILKLTPRYFLWKEESGLPTDLRQLGFYAQEVNEALGEEVANTPKNKNDKWGIYDRGIIAMLTKAMQEQQAQIEELKTQIQTLLNK